MNTELKPTEPGQHPALPMNLPQISSGPTAHAPAHPSAPTPDAQTLRRRKFLNWLCIGLGTTSLGSVIWAVVGFMLAPLARQSKGEWRAVGKIGDFQIGKTVVVKLEDASTVPWAGYAARTAAWLRRDGEAAFTCFSVNCTHLGCPVRWIDTAQLFMCPCHGGVYYQDGSVAAGPPPLPLPRYEVRVRDGNVEVMASAVPITKGA